MHVLAYDDTSHLFQSSVVYDLVKPERLFRPGNLQGLFGPQCRHFDDLFEGPVLFDL